MVNPRYFCKCLDNKKTKKKFKKGLSQQLQICAITCLQFVQLLGDLLARYQGSVPMSPQLPEDSTLENKLAQMYSCNELLMSYNGTLTKTGLVNFENQSTCEN